jgi:hypothetical protein
MTVSDFSRNILKDNKSSTTKVDQNKRKGLALIEIDSIDVLMQKNIPMHRSCVTV